VHLSEGRSCLSENVSQQYGDHAMYFPREFVNPYYVYVAPNTG